MADSRLDELHRQRALVQEHLAWIDREIRAEELAGQEPAKSSTPPPDKTCAAPAKRDATDAVRNTTNVGRAATNPAGTSPDRRAPARVSAPAPVSEAAVTRGATRAAAASDTGSDAVGDDILDQYRVPATSLQSDVRKGCWLYLVGALVVLGLVVAVLYVTISRR